MWVAKKMRVQEWFQDPDLLVVEVGVFLVISLKDFQLALVIVLFVEWSLIEKANLNLILYTKMEVITGRFKLKRELDVEGFSVGLLSLHLHLHHLHLPIGLHLQLKVLQQKPL